MKTKVLLLTVALGAAGAATSMAQVFSANAVGYINVTIPAGKIDLISNQLSNKTVVDLTLPSLLPYAPDGTTIYEQQANGDYHIATFIEAFGVWDQPGIGEAPIQIVPGRGVWLLNPAATNLTVTFVGDVAQNTLGAPPSGQLSTPVPTGISIISSLVPQEGGLTTLHQYPAVDGDVCYQWDFTANGGLGGYIIRTYIDVPMFFTGWDPAEPIIKVGQSFFIQTAAAKPWIRNFTVQ